jgi:Cd2+/Zn2+-exporting ATPase
LQREIILENLCCPICGNEIVKTTSQIKGVKNVFINPANNQLQFEIDDSLDVVLILQKVNQAIATIKPHHTITSKKIEKLERSIFILEGLSCALCAGKIEKEVKELPGVRDARVDFITKKMILDLDKNYLSDSLMASIQNLARSIEPKVMVRKESEKSILTESKQIKQKWIRIALGSVFYAGACYLNVPANTSLLLFIVSYLIIGGEVLLYAIKNLVRGKWLDENFLMSLATVGAFAIREYPEAVAVMLFYQIGELLQEMAVHRSRKMISSLLTLRPDFVNKWVGSELEKVDPQSIKVGDRIQIKPGERIALDGIVREGISNVDTSAITGESVPRTLKEGKEALSGFLNQTGILSLEVTKELKDSTLSRILQLVEDSTAHKAKSEKLITRFSQYYTPIVVFLALTIAFAPPIFVGWHLFSTWFYRALIFLVVSCPCALMVSIPLGFIGGIGCASRNGILVKGGNYLEMLSQARTIVFDKTGTLTKGSFEVSKIQAVPGVSSDDLLKWCAYGEFYSYHPIAGAILKKYRQTIQKELIQNYEEIAGMGISATISGQHFIIGNQHLMRQHQITFSESQDFGSVVYAAKEGNFIGSILVNDEVKPSTKEAITTLKSLGIHKMVMLSGDQEPEALRIAKQIGLDTVYANLLPQDKVTIVEKLLKETHMGEKLIFVGDGVNDAPVLARADIGISMGGLGSDCAIEASDVVIMTDELTKVPEAILISRKTRLIVIQNIVLALGIKVAIMTLGVFGKATLWEAVFGDVGVALLAVLNSLRVLSFQPKK